MPKKKKSPPTAKTYGEYHYTDLHPNPLNPRRIFDKYKLDALEESIRSNKILVPLTVYREKDNRLYILDGERRWRCAQRIETGEVSTELDGLPKNFQIPSDLDNILSYDASTKVLTHRAPIDAKQHKRLLTLADTKAWETAANELYDASKERRPQKVSIPVNIVDPPTPTANMLYMFHVHNLREQWELMPTALSLQIIMKELGVEDDAALSELTRLSKSKVKYCKMLLNFPEKYQSMMLNPDPDERLKSNLFIEMHPVLDLYEDLGKRVSAGNDREELTDLFIEKYKNGLINAVTDFRRILEARQLLEDEDRLDEFKFAARRFVEESSAELRRVFVPLAAEEKEVQNATSLLKDFLTKLRKLKISYVTTKRDELTATLKAVQKQIDSILESLEGE